MRSALWVLGWRFALLATMTSPAAATTVIASDDASNYAGGWTNGANGGEGFREWKFGYAYRGTNSIGDPYLAGITNMGRVAFVLSADAWQPGEDQAPGVSVERQFGSPAQVGDTLTFQWGVNQADRDSYDKGFVIGGYIRGSLSEPVVVFLDPKKGSIEVRGNFENTSDHTAFIVEGSLLTTWYFTVVPAGIAINAWASNGTNTTLYRALAEGPGVLLDGFRLFALWSARNTESVYFNNFKIFRGTPLKGLSLRPDRKFLFSWTDTPPVHVQRRSSLSAGGWETVASNVVTGSFLDSATPDGSAFYRLVVPQP
jgi:hypothetical protein